MKFSFRAIFLLMVVFSVERTLAQQQFTTIPDTSLFMVDTLRPLLLKLGNVQFSGYLQPQYQWTETKGAKGFAAGDFSANANNRFSLRRGRLRIDYLKLNAKKLPKVYFVFQFDGTERGVFIRDFFGRYYEQKWGLISFTAGMFARPFSYEVNWSSAVRETPERGRVTQIMMPTERDLGAMITFQPKRLKSLLSRVALDLAVSNGQGLAGPVEFDNHKDFTSRLSFVRASHFEKFDMSASVGYLKGGLNQAVSQRYTMTGNAFVLDSNPSNVGRLAPREYYEADIQLRFKTKWGITELRGEYWMGTQTGQQGSNKSPGTTGELANPVYIRRFDAFICYFIQPIINPKWQIVVKYDWFDPNTKIGGNTIGQTGLNLSDTDIKYQTLGFGLNYYMNPNLKFMAYYDMIRNENTSLKGYEKEMKDDVMTLRVQFMF